MCTHHLGSPQPYHQRSQNVAGGFARFLGVRGTCAAFVEFFGGSVEPVRIPLSGVSGNSLGFGYLGLMNFRVRHTSAYPRT